MQSSSYFYAAIGLACATALFAGPASSQEGAQGSTAASEPQTQSQQAIDEQVVVRGQRLSELEFDLPEYISNFIDEVVSLPPGTGFARWHKSVCVGVNNLAPTAAQYIVDRISLLAREVGLEAGEPGCRAEVFIIFTTDADDLASYMVENEELMFRPSMGGCCTNLGIAALSDFAESDRPVRWWHVSMPMSSHTGDRAVILARDAPGSYPVVAVSGPSRVHNGIRDEMQYVIVIVDATKLRGTSWQQIGDYLALVSLAQINPNADPTDFDSILNLFTNPAAYSGLTDWDRSYVRALYEINLERFRNLQQNHVVSHIVQQERALSD